MNTDRLPVPIYQKVPRMEDISIDCETLGLRFDAPIIAIGAVAFDIKTGKFGKTFYQLVSIDSAIKSGRVDGGTLCWWMTQSADAKKANFDPKADRLDLASALANLTSWVREMPPSARVWANGPAQDIAWLEHAYTVGCVGLREGWYFKNVRDVRTIIDAADVSADLNAIPDQGEQHNALSDAKWQALAVSMAWQKIRGEIALGKKASKTAQQQAVAIDEDDDL